MTRTVFYGFGAYVGSLTGTTTCGFWPDDPTSFKWDHTRLVPVDLGKTPRAHQLGTIALDDIEVDDHVSDPTPGLTKIGPMWPDGTTCGAVWLASTYYDRLDPNVKPPRVPPGGDFFDYELTSVVTWIGSTMGSTMAQRFHGVHASIQQVAGTLALVTIWHPGTSQVPNQPPAATLWLDLARAASPIADGFTRIGLDPRDPQTGALFLDQPTARVIALRGPKVPKNLGSDFLPAGAR